VNRLVLYAHFDVQREVKPYVLFHLQALKEWGANIIFISNSGLPVEETAKIQSMTHQVLLRENRGMDFGMWKEALASVRLDDLDELVLTNSSVAGPFHPLEPIHQRMQSVACDFWGMTESREICHHLQSYFLVFRRPAFESEAFGQFWASVLPYRSKLNIIHSYELGLSVFLEENGFKSAVAFPMGASGNGLIHNVLYRRNPTFQMHHSRNPTLYYPDQLIRAGMPYLKLQLFQQNPYKLSLGLVQKLARRHGFDLGFLDPSFGRKHG
jgi:lipopolysaccharide biosynthesis protein